jgi:DNA-binding transcriptional regulator YhcF (GntR family)
MPHAPAIPNWTDDAPIYRQLMTCLLGRIPDKTHQEGEWPPLARQRASDCETSPLTVAKAYEKLASEGWTEKLRGEGPVARAREAALHRHQHLGAVVGSSAMRLDPQGQTP